MEFGVQSIFYHCFLSFWHTFRNFRHIKLILDHTFNKHCLKCPFIYFKIFQSCYGPKMPMTAIERYQFTDKLFCNNFLIDSYIYIIHAWEVIITIYFTVAESDNFCITVFLVMSSVFTTQETGTMLSLSLALALGIAIESPAYKLTSKTYSCFTRFLWSMSLQRVNTVTYASIIFVKNRILTIDQ